MLLLVVDSGTRIHEVIGFHGAIHIALGGGFCFLQGGIVQLFVKAVFDMVVGYHLIAAKLRFCCRCFGLTTKGAVSIVQGEHLLEVLPVLRTEDGVSQRGITELNLSVRYLLHPEGGIVQIDGITDLIIPVRFLLGVVHGQLLVIYFGQVLEIQILQLAVDQSFKGFVLSGADQHITQITLHAEVNQIDICLDGDFIIRDSGMGNTDGGKVTEVSTGIELSLTVAFNQLLGSRQFGIRHGLCVQNGLTLFHGFGRKVTVVGHKITDTGGDLRPGELDLLAAVLPVPDALGVVILKAEISTGYGMGVTAHAVLFLQEIDLFFLAVGREKVIVDTPLASGEVAAARQLLVDLVIGDEMTDNGHIRHFSVVFSAGKLQLLQLFQDAVEVMMLVIHQAPILLVFVQKLCVLLGQNGTELGIGKPFRQLLGFFREALELIMIQDIQVVALMSLFAHVTVQKPKSLGKLLTLILGCFRKLHIGGKPAILQKLTDSLCGFRPGDHLRGLGIPCSSSHRQMDAVISIPRTDAPAIFLDTVTTVVAFLDKLFQFIGGLLLHELCGDLLAAVPAIGAQHQDVVDFLLRKRKSRELFVLCFINYLDLFFLGEIEAQAQLLISSVITTSSACAFRLFMCCTQPI